jgi:streptogramin lyase
VAIDPSTNRIYVADTSNSRVVWWNSVSSLVTGQEADGVIGQRDLNSNDWDETPTAASLDYPTGVAVDAAGNLWVVDHEDSWILKFSAPVVSAASATLVLGQNDFISDSINMGGLVGSNTLNRPFFLHVDNNDVWVSDWGNHRILRFTNPTMNGAAASLVLGQSDFLSNSANKGGAVSDSGLNYPYDFFVSSAGLV